MSIHILDLQLSNKEVEWEEKNYLIVFYIFNQNTSTICIENIDVSFFYANKKTTENFEITLPEIIFNTIDSQKKIRVSAIINIKKYTPIGKHDLQIKVGAKDIISEKIFEDAIEIKNCLSVEPCGRKIVATPSNNVRFGESTSFGLQVILEGKKDITYSGKHTILFSSNDLPNEKKAEIPKSLTLNFNDGFAQTKKAFTFYNHNAFIELYEVETGGVSGLLNLKVRRELFSKKLNNLYFSLLSFIKNYKSAFLIAFVFILFVAFGYYHWLGRQDISYAKIISFRGKITVKGKNSSQKKILKKDDVILINDFIQVEKDGFCVLQCENGGRIKLYGSSNIYSSSRNSFSLKNGEIEYQASNYFTPFNISTPHIDVLDIFSKHFHLKVQTKQSTLSVFHGKINVTAQGKSVNVNSKHGIIVKKGEIPGSIQKLPEPPRLVTPTNGKLMSSRIMFFEWEKREQAHTYSVEVSNINNYPLPEYLEQTENSKIRIAIDEGEYKWHVSTINEVGFASSPSKVFVFQSKIKLNMQIVKFFIHAKNKEKQIVDYDLFVDGKKFNFEDGISLGKHQIVVKKDGYFSKILDIEISKEDVFVLKIGLIAKPVFIKWTLSETSTTVEHNGKKIRNLPKKLIPGKHTFVFKRKGYYPLKRIITITPSNKKISEKVLLKIKKRSIQVIIKPNIKINIFSPKVTFNGKNIPSEILPGKYKMKVTCPGFFPIKKRININPGDKLIIIKDVMKQITRQVLLLTQNVPKNLMIIGKKNNIKKQFSLNNIYFLSLGVWYFHTKHSDYYSIIKKVNITQNKKILTINFSLQKRESEIISKITFSHAITQNMKIILENNNSGKRIILKNNMKLPFGKYSFIVQAFGYKTQSKTIIIKKEKTLLSMHLEKNKRIVTNSIKNIATGKQEKIISIIKNGKKQIFPFEFEANTTHSLTILLTNGSIIQKDIYIPSGKGNFLIELLLAKFDKTIIFHFLDTLAIAQIRKNEEISLFKRKLDFVVDGIGYDFAAFENGAQIARNRIQLYPLLDIYKVSFSKLELELRVEIGFYSGSIFIDHEKEYKFELKEINLKKLKQHFEKISSEKKKKRIQIIQKQYKEMVNAWSLEELNLLK